MTLDRRTTHYHRTKKVMIQWSIVLIILIAVVYMAQPVKTPVSPSPFYPINSVSASEPEEYKVDDMSVYISEAVQEFLPKHKSESLMIMHCLAHRENGHAANRNCGDSGKACGPYQFHQPTWEGYRKLMIKEGKATEIGNRYDKKESARTTAWAISTSCYCPSNCFFKLSCVHISLLSAVTPVFPYVSSNILFLLLFYILYIALDHLV